MKTPRTRFLGTIAGFRVYLVSGAYVRNHHDIDFTQGGNEAIYPLYVPPGEIWIDDGIGPLDQMATALHEIVECDLMLHHGWTYDRAHDMASKTEGPFRRELARRPPRRFSRGVVAAAFAAFRARKSPAMKSAQRDGEIAVALRRRG